MTNNLSRNIKFDDGGPSMEDMGFDFQDCLHHENDLYERMEYSDGLIVFRDKTGRWDYQKNNVTSTCFLDARESPNSKEFGFQDSRHNQEKISTTDLLYKLENQIK